MGPLRAQDPTSNSIPSHPGPDHRLGPSTSSPKHHTIAQPPSALLRCTIADISATSHYTPRSPPPPWPRKKTCAAPTSVRTLPMMPPYPDAHDTCPVHAIRGSVIGVRSHVSNMHQSCPMPNRPRQRRTTCRVRALLPRRHGAQY
jgi:hypothetical protein